MNTRIAEIDNQLRALYAEKELIENAEKAANAKELISILPQLNYGITEYPTVQIYVSELVEPMLEAVVTKMGGHWNHFEAPITEQISFRADDGRYRLQFNPTLLTEERLKKECDNDFQLTQIIKFLNANGVKASQYDVDSIRKDIEHHEKTIKTLRDRMAFVGNLINFTE